MEGQHPGWPRLRKQSHLAELKQVSVFQTLASKMLAFHITKQKEATKSSPKTLAETSETYLFFSFWPAYEIAPMPGRFISPLSFSSASFPVTVPSIVCP